MIHLEVGQIITQIFAFLVMLWVLKRYGWQPLLSLLEERQQKIKSEFDQIAAEKGEVKKLEEEYREKLKGIEKEARHEIQDAVNQGRKIAMEIQQDAQSVAKALIDKAKLEAERELTIAKKKFKEEIVNTSVTIAEKILQEKLDEETHKKLIAEFVREADLK